MVADENSRHGPFGQIAFESERVAAGLLACGVRPGDVVSWQLPNGIETITLTLALARLGVVQNPLVMMLRERELGFICRQARSRWLLVPPTFRGTDHRAMAESVARSAPGLRVLPIDGPLPSGDPRTLPPPPDDGSRGAVDLLHLGHHLGPQGRPAHRRRACWPRPRRSATTWRSGRRMSRPCCCRSRTSAASCTSSARCAPAAPWSPARCSTRRRRLELLAAHGVTLLGNGLPFLRGYLARQAESPFAAVSGGAGRALRRVAAAAIAARRGQALTRSSRRVRVRDDRVPVHHLGPLGRQ